MEAILTSTAPLASTQSTRTSPFGRSRARLSFPSIVRDSLCLSLLLVVLEVVERICSSHERIGGGTRCRRAWHRSSFFARLGLQFPAAHQVDRSLPPARLSGDNVRAQLELLQSLPFLCSNSVSED